MRRSIIGLIHWLVGGCLSAMLVGCAGTVVLPPPPDLFNDALFAPPVDRIDAGAVFAVSEPMRQYVHAYLSREARQQSRRDGLVQALYGPGKLKIGYDTEHTRTASEAFDARAGNCLSLVIMTAAFARDLELDVRFQATVIDETWSRQGDLLVGAGHVNIMLGSRRSDARIGFQEAPLTIDFLPQEVLPGMRIRTIDEATVLAMFMNNRAVETMSLGRLDDAYAWAREAVRQNPAYGTAYNTLGVVYQRHGNLVEAGRAYDAALAHDADDPRALANMAELRSRQGQNDQAAVYRQRLARLKPSMPYVAFSLGQEAMRRQDFSAARAYFTQEIARSADDHELHFWLALADYRLGAIDEADAQLRLAIAGSPTQPQHDLYAAKLEWLEKHKAGLTVK